MTMRMYAEQISKQPLFQLLKTPRSGTTLSSADLDSLAGMVLDVAEIVGPLLSEVPVTFKQYTKHDLAHSVNLMNLMERFIPATTKEHLSGIEVAVLILSALLHDLGMYVTESERMRFLESDEFQSFLAASPAKQRAMVEAEAAGQRGTVRAIEDAALADYFRKLHPERVRLAIDEHLAGKLTFANMDLSSWVKTICESHGWPVYESNDPLHPNRAIARSLKRTDPIFGIDFHPQYIACCLRLADIMDFDPSRAPLALLKTITDQKSQSEWQKHLQITGWTVDENNVEFHARCTHPEHYVAVMEFLDAIDNELIECRRLVVRDSTYDTVAYKLHLPTAADRIYVRMADESYIAGSFRFELEYERILTLLMDKSLYPDPSLFLRELLQNSLDACRLRHAIIESQGGGHLYTPHIVVWDKTDEPQPTIIFQDNGIGMSESIVKNYFMRVGRSYYRSAEFDAQRHKLAQKGIALEATSQFGIGFLSCFMVADRVEIRTYRIGETPLHITIESPTRHFVIRRESKPEPTQLAILPAEPELDGPPDYAGTKITVYMKEPLKFKVIDLMREFASNIEAEIVVIDGEARNVIAARRWEREPASAEQYRRHFARWFNGDVAQDVVDGVVTVEVDLGRYDFCNGLHGRAWFWFLRGADGNPVPRRGFLSILSELAVIGAPREITYRSISHGELLTQHLDRDAPHEVGEYVQSWWNTATLDDRQRYVAWQRRKKSEYWFLFEGAMTALVAEDSSWLDLPLYYHSDMHMSLPRDIGLHGIRLPAGIVEWNPMQGSAETYTLFNFPVGYRIDDRRKAAVVPAANRLFVNPSEGAGIAVPLGRAFLLEALQLSRSGSEQWCEWLENFLDAAKDGDEYWLDITTLERNSILNSGIRLYRVGRTFKWMTIDEMIAEFGSTVRLAPEHQLMEETLVRSGAAAILLMDKRVIRRGDSIEVDLESVVERKLTSLRDAFKPTEIV